MARIRTVKPELFKHEALFDAEQETGLPLRIAFVGLFTVADRDGRFKWRPRQLKTEVLPYDEVDFSRVLHALWTRGFLVRYECGTDGYGCIPSFSKHQVINNREAESELPTPSEGVLLDPNIHADLDAIGTRDPRVNDATSTPLVHAQAEGKGREGKGREGKGTSEQSPDEPPPSRPKKWGTTDDHQAARYIFDGVRRVAPSAKDPNWDAWANDIRLMREQDGHDHRAICAMFRWANHDGFWASNILSPATLREKWVKLEAKRAMPQTNGFDLVAFNAAEAAKAKVKIFGPQVETEGETYDHDTQ